MPKKILLADDSITIQKVVELTFSDGDYEVIATSNGNKAIQKLADVRPDIILSDIIMPEKNGYELCEYVKSHPDFRAIPVILLTGTFEPFDPDRAEKAGCDAVITKPFESQSLIHKVEELIRGAAPAGATAAETAPAAAKPAEEPSAFTPSPEAETRAFAPPKLDDDWGSKTAPTAPLVAPTPATQPFKPPPPPPPAGASSFQQSSFEEQGKDLFGGSAPPPPSGFDQPPSMPAQEETEIDYSGATKAFPKMSFEDLQRMSAGGETAPEPMPPEETPWSPPEEAAPASEWASPEVPESGFGAPAGKGAGAEISPFEESAAAPPPPSTESIFDSTGPGRSAAPTWPTSPPPSPPETPARAAEAAPAPSQPVGELTDEQVDRIARRVVELLSDQVIRSIAWEVIPDLAEMVVRERIRQLENET